MEDNVKDLLPKLKIVVLDNFYSNMEDARSREFFLEMLQIRKDGYGPDYPERHLPIDGADFIARHNIICISQSSNLYPVATFLNVDIARYQYYHLSFPILNAAKAIQSAIHINAVESILNQNKHATDKLGYFGGFTIRKQIRRNQALSKKIKELVVGTLYSDFIKNNYIGAFTAGVPRFKTDQVWIKAGYNMLKYNEVALPVMPKFNAEGEPLTLMYAEKMSEWSQQCFEENRRIFQERIHLGTNAEEVKHQLTAS